MQKSKELDKLHKSYVNLLSALKNHNLENAEASVAIIQDLQEGFWDKITSYVEQALCEVEKLKEIYTDNFVYSSQLYDALSSRGIIAELQDNTILAGPIEITVNVTEYSILMSIGRKKIRITDLEISKVTKQIELTFKKINSSFNPNSYFKRLLRAYEYAYTRMYASRDVRYGYGVSLKDLFDIFTISPGSADYKIENFLWDLGRLVSIANKYESYRVELGFSRDVKKMFLIKTANGETLKVSTMTIHKEG